MEQKLAFIGTPVTHAEFLAEMIRHREADRIAQGYYWDKGRGCAVGCAIESLRRLTGAKNKHTNYNVYAAMTHIPLELIYLEECIFERLPISIAADWPVAFISAISEGADLSEVSTKFRVRVLREIVLPTAGEASAIVKRVADGLACGWTNGDTVTAAAASAASATHVSDTTIKSRGAAYVTYTAIKLYTYGKAYATAHAIIQFRGFTVAEQVSLILLEELRATKPDQMAAATAPNDAEPAVV